MIPTWRRGPPGNEFFPWFKVHSACFSIVRMSRARAYAQLIRLPNVFTAAADIVLGAVAGVEFAGGALPQWWQAKLGLLLAASACLYSGGMVWNDFFDLKQDKRERPFRPIPSGRIRRRTAGWLGVV